MRKSEILSPVGGEEQLVAAVRSGADAVYFGTKVLNARRNASNFDGESLENAIRYCHERGVRVYITLNTLVCDDEIPLLREEIVKVAKAGADALIIQDLACMRLASEICPEMERHASTQMAVHNVAGVRALRDMGFSRVVVARELSFEEIKKIRTEVPETELEVFVHGALCMSVSGACYMSSVIGERSGNRGLCAQPCRLDFRTDRRDYALSLKDMCIIPRLRELEELGIASFKIEGRMKRPEYVAAATDACVRSLRGENADLSVLRDVFSRGGFTEGYYTGKRNASMFGHRTKEDVEASASVIKSLRSLYSRENGRVPVSMDYVLKEDENSLTVTAGGHTVRTEGELPRMDTEHAIGREDVERLLGKTGNTPFTAEEIKTDIGKDLGLAFSQINAMRREALDLLTEKMGEVPERKICGNVSVSLDGASVRTPGRALWGSFEKASQVSGEDLLERIVLPAEEIVRSPGTSCIPREKLIARLPHIIFPEYEEKYLGILKELKKLGITDVMCDNIGFMSECVSEGFAVHGGFGLNIANSLALKEYADLGLKDAVVSFELSFARISSLRSRIPLGILGYGYLPLMNYRSCPLRNEKGCGSCSGEGTVTDRKGNVFRVACRDRMYSVLYNCVPLYIGDRKSVSDYALLMFTDETAQEAERIIKDYSEGRAPSFERTSGLYRRNLM